MSQTLALVVLFIAGIATLPWLVRRLQQRQGAQGVGSATTRVLAQAAVGPQQRVVTVEVGEGAQGVRLVLGVTAQHIQCLHVLGQPATAQPAAASFAGVMAQVQDGTASTTTTAQP